MSISDGANANAANFNSSFVSKTDADSKGGDLTLNDKLSLQDSGSATMTDAQQEINDLKDEFNSSAGHEHDGVDSKKIVATNLDGTGGANGQVLKADGAGNVLWDTDEGTGAINYIGAWNANTNSPALASSTGTKGDYYVVNVAGTTTLDGISDWENTDWVVFNGTVWEKVDNTDQVLSVAGKQGAVTLDADDVSETTFKKWALKSNVSTASPTATDDSTDGYSVGSRWWNSNSNVLYICEDNTASAAVWEIATGGGGAGDANTIHLIESDNISLSDIDLTGQNADFDGGGTITAGSLTLSTAAADLIKGSAQAIHYDPDADGQNDYFGFTKSIPQGFRGRSLGISFEYKNDSTTVDNDFRLAVKQKDGTNAGNIEYFDMEAFNNANNISVTFSTDAFISDDCTEIEFGWQNTSTTTTVELSVDNILVSADPFVYKDLTDKQFLEYSALNNTFQDQAGEVRFPSGFDSTNLTGTSILKVEDDSGNTRTKFTAIKKCSVDVNWSASMLAQNNAQIYKNGTEVVKGGDAYVASAYSDSSAAIELDIGDFITVGSNNSIANNAANAYLSIFASAETEHVITPAKSNMEDWEAFTPTGSWTTNTTYTGTKRRVGDTMELRVKVSLSGAPNVAQLKIDIPDSLSIDTSKIQDETENITFGQASIVDITGSAYVGRMGYDSATQVDVNVLNSSSTYVVRTQVTATSPFTFASGDFLYLEFKVPIEGWSSDASFLAAIPTQLTSYIKDVKSDGTAGGTFTSGAWQTRDLNTVEGDSSFITLSSNQFTLGPGKYEVDATAPFYRCDENKAKIRNITDATDEIIGQAGNFSPAGSSNGGHALVKGQIEITESKTFELQHRCSVTQSTTGFGLDQTYGVDEVYSIVKITKVK